MFLVVPRPEPARSMSLALTPEGHHDAVSGDLRTALKFYGLRDNLQPRV